MYLVSLLDEDVEEDELDVAETAAEAAAAWLVATATELDDDEVAICSATELVGATGTSDELRAVELGSVAELAGRATKEEVLVLKEEVGRSTPELL